MRTERPIFILFFLLLPTSLALAQDLSLRHSPGLEQSQNLRIDKKQAEQLGRFKENLEKLDREFIRKKDKLEYKAEELEGRFDKKKADLEKEIAAEPNEKKRTKLENKLQEETGKYSRKKTALDEKLRKETEKHEKARAALLGRISAIQGTLPPEKGVSDVSAKEAGPPLSPTAGKPARSEWIDKKATEKATEEVKKWLDKLENDHAEKKAELEGKIGKATDEKESGELKNKLAELEEKYRAAKEKLQETLLLLELFPIEKPSRDTQNKVLAGICGDLNALIGDPRRVIESNGPPTNCRFYPSRRYRLRVNNPSENLKRSTCWNALEGAFVCEMPSMLVFEYWNSVTSGGPPIYVFVDMRELANYASFTSTFNEHTRDEFLLSVCPQTSPQRFFPMPGLWYQLNFTPDPGRADYDSIIENLLNGRGSYRGGMEALPKTARSQQVNEFKQRNIVLDDKFPPLIDETRRLWTKIDEVFTPLFAPNLKKWEFANSIKKRLEETREANRADVLPGLSDALASAQQAEHAETAEYFKEEIARITDAKKKAEEGKAKNALEICEKTLESLNKKMRGLEKEINKYYLPRKQFLYLVSQWEFVPSIDALEKFVSIHPDGAVRLELKKVVKEYEEPAKKAAERTEKLKHALASAIKEDQFAEPIPIKAGERVVFQVSAEGGNYDREVNKPRWKARIENDLLAADASGTVPKNAKPEKEFTPALLSVKEAIDKGFDVAVAETKGKITIISHIRRTADGADVFLRSFGDSAEVSKGEMPLSELMDKGGVRWLVILFERNDEGIILPKDPTNHLQTFLFIDREGTRLTVSSFIFSSSRRLSLVSNETGRETAEFNIYFYPGVYRYWLTLIDLLETDPKRRSAKFTPLYFRVLPPED